MTRCTGDASSTRGRSRSSPRKLKDYLDRLGTVWVEGEITQWGVSGGNVYGKLKDLEADVTISFTMWSSVRARLSEQFKQGDHVDPAREADLVGQGRHALDAGLRHAARRPRRPARAPRAPAVAARRRGPVRRRPQAAPPVPARRASASSPAGTATPRRTCCATRSCAGRRSSSASAYATVQGDRTAPEVVDAIRRLDADPEVEVIIVARGGGDFQNLLGFSDETRRAGRRRGIHAHRVSAIGHEADRPLLDEVADLRASTPTDAAKRVVPDVAEELARVAAGAGAPRHAPLVDPRRARSTGSGTCVRVRRSPTPAGSSTVAPRSSPGGSRAAPSSSIAASSAQVARVGELARPPACALAAGDARPRLRDRAGRRRARAPRAAGRARRRSPHASRSPRARWARSPPVPSTATARVGGAE